MRALLTTVVVLALLAPVRASTLLPADFRVVVADASIIVRGRVTDVRAVRALTGEIETVATIAVDAVLKGSAPAFVSMRVPGGTLGRVRSVMPGAPQPVQGEIGVYLLKRMPGGALWPVGLSAGVYRVTQTAGRLMVVPPVVPGTTTASTGRVVRGDTRRRSLPLAEFESIVALVVRGASVDGAGR